MKKLIATIFLAAALLATGFARSNDNGRFCSAVITACGCTIHKTACIRSQMISLRIPVSLPIMPASAWRQVVVLLANGYSITGAGVGTGINVLPGLRALFFPQRAQAAYSAVSGWHYGMQVTASGVTSEGFYFFKT